MGTLSLKLSRSSRIAVATFRGPSAESNVLFRVAASDHHPSVMASTSLAFRSRKGSFSQPRRLNSNSEEMVHRRKYGSKLALISPISVYSVGTHPKTLSRA